MKWQDDCSHLQVSQLCEALATLLELTMIGLDLLVNDSVRPHVARLRKAPAAEIALERSLACVPSFMGLQRSEWTLSMQEELYLEISHLRKALSTASCFASLMTIPVSNADTIRDSDESYVWFIPCVCAAVDIQPAPLREDLSTRRHLALVKPSSSNTA